MLNTTRNIISSDATTQEMIAPVIDTLVATKNYSIGEEFIYAGTLYKVISAIAVGNTITLGSGGNADTASTVSEEAYRINDATETDIADGDYFPFFDVSANGKKKSLWSNIKTKLKAYFDPIYKDSATIGTSGSYTKVKVKINSTIPWMLCFVVTIYSEYHAIKIMISGYNYINGNNYWSSPKAVVIADSEANNGTAPQVYFGYDALGELWVGFDCLRYVGIRVDEVVNGYTQINDKSNLFTVTLGTSLSGTIQTTVTAKRPTYQ